MSMGTRHPESDSYKCPVCTLRHLRWRRCPYEAMLKDPPGRATGLGSTVETCVDIDKTELGPGTPK